MLNGDCRRKFDFSSEPVRAHVPPLWLSLLYMFDWKKMPAETLYSAYQRAVKKWSVLIRQLKQLLASILRSPFSF
jgi:hypothetical protein